MKLVFGYSIVRQSQVDGCAVGCWSEQVDGDVLVPEARVLIPSNQCGPQSQWWEVGVVTYWCVRVEVRECLGYCSMAVKRP